MNKGSTATKCANLLTFDQPGDFYHRIAQKHADSYQYFSALDYARKAAERDPNCAEFLLEYADIYSEMGYYDDSNLILFDVLQRLDNNPQCYFSIGFNFLGLHQFMPAYESFEKYLELNRQDDLDFDEDQFEEVMESQDMIARLLGMEEDGDDEQQIMNAVDEAKHLLDHGDYRKAANMMEKTLEQNPSLVFVRVNLSMAYFCLQQLDKAIVMALSALKIDPRDIHAHCNLAIFYQAVGNEEAMNEHLDELAAAKTDYYDDTYRIAVTYCELGLHNKAYPVLRTALRMMPYDKKLLHFAGLNAFNLELYSDAVNCWSKILIIHPNDSVAAYYRKYAIAVMNGDAREKILSYIYQVPYEEILHRIRRLNDIMRLDSKDIRWLWEQDEDVSLLLLWGMGLSDTLIKRMILRLIGSLRDERAQMILRRFLLSRDEAPEMKREALAALKEMKAPEPYLAVMDGHVMEVCVKLHDAEKYQPKVLGFSFILDNSMRIMSETHGTEFAQEAVGHWRKWLADGKLETLDEKSLLNGQGAWTAAIEYLHCQRIGRKQTQGDLIKRHHTTPQTFHRSLLILSQIADTLSGGEGKL